MPSSSLVYQVIETSGESSRNGVETSKQQAARPHHEPLEIIDDHISSPNNTLLTPFQATIHLIKGNLGPGVLNLPHAFSNVGNTSLSVSLFLIVAAQGIYSMVLLCYCKRKSRGSFMDVSYSSLGVVGSQITSILLLILQGGVCCVFLALVSANLQVVLTINDTMSICITTITLLFITLLRFIKDLTLLSLTANCIMLGAIVTSMIAGVVHSMNDSDDDTTDTVGADLGAGRRRHLSTSSTTLSYTIANFVSDMFFAFEGIGLVLPIENSYDERRSSFSFQTILIWSMGMVALLFVLTGVLGSFHNNNISSGSITAYLEERYPNNLLYSSLNTLVAVAVLLTFPLQLQPCMQVIDRWLDHGENRKRDYCCCCRETASGSSALPTREQQDDTCDDDECSEQQQEQDGVMYDNSSSSSSLDTRCCGIKRWIWRRWCVVMICALIVMYVDNLSTLIALFGSIGQTGLAAMPCLIHLGFMKQGVVGVSVVGVVVDVLVVLFCSVVMVAGVVTYFVE